MWGGIVFGYHLLSRLAYVVGVGVALTRQQRDHLFTRRDGVEAGFQRFRRIASALMNNDAVGFVLLCVVTRETLTAPVSRPAMVGLGVLLVAVGIGTKLWAAAQLGSRGYHWYNFFTSGEAARLTFTGPYRFLKNPMYTVGYLQTYGLALVFGSWPALVASAFDQVAILTFHSLVEKPHFEALTKGVVPR